MWLVCHIVVGATYCTTFFARYLLACHSMHQRQTTKLEGERRRVVCGDKDADGERQVSLKWLSKLPYGGLSMSTMLSSLFSCVRSSYPV
ncbi:hypothetical protein GGI35DRAFT_442826 [Trichoderma velutinum]